jgi:ATP-dependent DNA helicase RecG
MSQPPGRRGPGTPLDDPVQYLKGVGPKRAELLARLGVHTARDLLFHVPRRYEDASTVTKIGEAKVGDDLTVVGEVVAKGVLPTRSRLRIFQAAIRDASGTIEVSWPGQPFLDRSIRKGDLLLVAGRVRFYHGKQIQPREWVVLGTAGEGTGGGRVLPVYASTDGLPQKVLRSIIDQSLDRLLPLVTPEDVLKSAGLVPDSLPTLMQALSLLHRPDSLAEAERGRRRLAWDEAFFLQLMHARARHRTADDRAGIVFRRTDEIIAPLYHGLPFTLTSAQTRAIAEILGDMTADRRMNRLLQGDVGSGKTIVALFAMALAVEAGYQAALMAPTEILAEQHARTIAGLAGPLDLEVVLLTGRLPAAERRAAMEAIAGGAARLVVGTHALIQEKVQFARLGLAVVDEQHRFGVRQRLALASQGDSPDVLVMSATPIPRSLALTLYGDLDLTVLDELPPSRTPVQTVVETEKERGRVHEFIREQVRQGRQAYIVYPLIDESEKVDLRAATDEHQKLDREVFPDLRVGLLHGQVTGEEKDLIMRTFAAGDIDVLVATTVIEVGIDVPNATVMVVEHAERFGLSQLHQLRGRVGRGADQSHGILVASGPPEAFARLRILAGTNDGFRIAREDLKLRGMGDFFGARQHGLPEFRFYDPERDEDLLIDARDSASAVIRQDPELERPSNSPLRSVIERRFRAREELYEVG